MSKAKPVKLKVDWATHEAAKFACEKWHYSKCLPTGKLVKVGAWEDGKYIGVVVFSRGASPFLLTKYKLTQVEGCELTRVALREHVTPVSRVLSIAIKFLRKSNTGLKLIVSFADPEQGHHGGIYQATNWVYSGRTKPKLEFIDKDGRRWHDRQVTESGLVKEFGRLKRCAKRANCREVRLAGKHRYLMPIDSTIEPMIRSLHKPYPKRASSVESGTSGYQPEGGGESPTDALHLSTE